MPLKRVHLEDIKRVIRAQEIHGGGYETIITDICTVQREQNTRSGNPQWTLIDDSGFTYFVGNDCDDAYKITQDLVGQRVAILVNCDNGSVDRIEIVVK